MTTDLDRLLAGDIDGDQLSPIKRLFTLGDAVRVLRRIAGKLGVDILDPTPAVPRIYAAAAAASPRCHHQRPRSRPCALCREEGELLPSIEGDAEEGEPPYDTGDAYLDREPLTPDEAAARQERRP